MYTVTLKALWNHLAKGLNLFDCQLSNEHYICHYYFQNVLYNLEKVKSNFRGQITYLIKN